MLHILDPSVTSGVVSKPYLHTALMSSRRSHSLHSFVVGEVLSAKQKSFHHEDSPASKSEKIFLALVATTATTLNTFADRCLNLSLYPAELLLEGRLSNVCATCVCATWKVERMFVFSLRFGRCRAVLFLVRSLPHSLTHSLAHSRVVYVLLDCWFSLLRSLFAREQKHERD